MGIVAYRDGNPAIVSSATKRTVRNMDTMAVADTGGCVAQRRLLDQGRRDQRQHALHLGDIDVLALARSLLMQQRRYYRGSGVEAADRIAVRGLVHDRRMVRRAGERGQSGGVFQGRSVSATIAPGIAGSESGHRQHDQAGPDVFQHGVIQAELAQHVGGIILDNGVRCSNELFQQRHALGVRKVEGDIQFVAVHQLEPRDFFVFLFCDERRPQIGAAPPIGILAGLHLDDFGTEFAQVARGGGTGPAHG